MAHFNDLLNKVVFIETFKKRYFGYSIIMADDYKVQSGYMAPGELKKKLQDAGKILDKAFEGIDEMLERDKKRSKELDVLLAGLID